MSDLREELQAALGTRYTIERELGGGGMSRVFVAHEPTLGRQVVIKVLPPEMAAGLSVERFRREILVAARLQHPNIVTLISAGDANGLPYFTMPLVDGESLRDRITRSGELPIADVIRIMRDVASGLACAHESGVLHRDIKPENILLAKRHALVVDFGVAKALADSTARAGPTLTSMGVVLGTPNYMAPEQAVADPNLDQRADLYALGATAYEMLVGAPPFAGRSAQAVMVAHNTEAVPPIEKFRPATPPALAALVMSLLEKHPADRPQSADDVLAALEAMATPTQGTPRTSLAPATEPLTLSRRGLGIAAVITVAVVAGLSVAVFASTRRRAPKPVAAPAVQSIAVLPFANVGRDTATEYFAEGMADELTTALGHIPGLRVAARSSAFTFRGMGVGAQEVGLKLHVGSILEGSVQRVAGRLRVTAQLISTADGLSMWTDAYERQAADVFQVQDELARDIAGALHGTLSAHTDSAGTAPLLAPRGTSNLAAYDLFLQGRYFLGKGGADPLWHAIALFKRAIAADSTFARAYAAMAMTYVLLPRYGVRPDSTIPLAEASAVRALALDTTVAEAHLALGDVRIHQWRWPEADRELQKSVDLEPSNPLVHLWHAELLVGLGHVEPAVDHARMAYDIDPLSPLTDEILGAVLVDARRYDEAADIARQGLALDSTSPGLHTTLMEAELFAGHRDSARAVSDRALRIAPRALGLRPVAMWVDMAAGRRADANTLLASLRRDVPTGTVSALELADAQLALGNTDSALVWVTRSIQRHDAESMWDDLACDPTFDALRANAQFVALMQPTGMRLCASTGAH